MKKFTLQLYAAKRNLLFALFFFSTLVASSQTFYVNDNSTVGDVYTSAVGNDSNPGTASAPFATIQAAIAASVSGDIINVDAGNFTENVTVDKRITLNGAGSGIAGTVVSVSTGSAITVTASGNDASNRLIVKNLRVTGGPDSGIYVTNATSNNYLTFDNIYALSNTDGISFAGTGSVSDVIISNSFLSNNINNGLRIASACPSFTGLTVSDSQMNSNGWQAFSYNANGFNVIGTDFNFTNCSFTNNCSSNANSAGLHDLSFYGFKGNATLTNVTVVANHTANGHGVVFTPQPLTGIAAGTITINGMTLTGSVAKSGLYFGTYSNLSGISLSNVDVSAVSSGNRAGWAGTAQMVVESAASIGLNLGTTTVKSFAVWNASPVDATAAIFKHTSTGAILDRSVLSDCYQIENQVLHATDVAGLGLVRVKASNIYVTQTSGSIQRGVNVATAGDVVNVDGGTFTESLTIDKSLTVLGPNSANSPNTGSRVAEAILMPNNATAITGNAANISVVFKGLTVDMANSTIDGNRFMYQVDKANTNWNFEKTIFKNAPASTNGNWWLTGSSAGLVFGLNDNLFTQNKQSNGIAIWTGSSAIVDIRNNVWENNGYTGLNLNYAQGVISGNTFRETRVVSLVAPLVWQDYQSGMLLQNASASNLEISNNTFTKVHNGITLWRGVAGPISIFGNEFNNTLRQSIFISNSGPVTGDISSVSVHENSFLNYAGSLFEISNVRADLQVLNATCNWFGTATSATIATKINGPVTYSPWLVNGTDNDLVTMGFQPVPGSCLGGLTVFVKDGTTLAVKSGHATIQAGVDAAAAGDIVEVSAGTFTENVTVNKRLSIIGAGSSLAGTVVQGVGGAGDVFTYTTGSGISGTPSSLEKMYLTGAAKGVFLGTNDYINLDDLDLVGLSSYGVELINNTNINITNSVFTSGASGIRLGTTASANTLLINGCTFSTNSEQAIHSFASATGGLTNVTITNNTITDCGLTNNMSAMYFEKLSNANISSNTITNTGASTNPRGIVLNMKTSAYSNVTIENNTLTENRTAVASLAAGYAIRFAGFSGGSLSTINVLGNNIDGYRTGVEYGAAVDRSTIQIKNNLINNVQLGVLSYSGTSSSSTQINDNSFTNLTFAIYNADAVGTSVAATCNWYGTTASGSIASKIFGTVTYSPWLVNGTDNNLVTSGFQPVPGSCTGTSVVIASAVPAGGCDIPGSIAVTFSGGVGPYNIAWTGGGSASGVTSPYTITALANGSYTATVTDANGSSATSDTVTVSGATSVTYYADADGDGFGNAAISVVVCVQPVNYVTNSTDCNDANALVWTTASFYVDADADGYSPSASSEILCYGATTPSGYAVGTLGLDCDDMIAAVNPGHVEVLYNGIDDNCDGQLDEGNQAKTTLQSVSCGATLSSMGSLIYANINYSASGYRFKVVNNTTGDIQYVDNSQHWFALNWLVSYDYGTAYTVSVQLQIAGVWVGYYGTSCLVNSPDITSSTGSLQLISTQCGVTLPSIGTILYTTAQSGATGYRFRITDVTPNATGSNLVQEKERSYHWFGLTMLTRYNYGSTYMVEVAVKTTGGYSGYGSPCYVNTPAVPMLANCGAVIPTRRTLVYTVATKSVTQYRFQVTNVSDQSSITFDTGRFWFSFRVNVPVHTPNSLYSVRVAVMTAGNWSPFGDACQITSPAVARTDGNAQLDFAANVFPNPYSDQFNLLVNTDSDERISYRVYDMLGKLIEADEFDYTALETKEFGRNYPAGVYNIIVSQGEERKTLRIIKR